MGSTPVASAIAESAKNRRSYRDYGSEAVSASEIAEILALASRAPSAWNLQPWRFVVITDPETKEALQGAAFGQKQVTGAPVVVVLYTDMVDSLARVDDVLHPSMPAEAKEGYKDRASTIETVNAELKTERGLERFRVRGLSKVRCVALWSVLAYNVMHFGWQMMSLAG